MTAATLRRSPVTGLAVVRAQLALVAALVVGGAVVLVVAAAAGDVSGASWWAAVGGGFACASGLVFGATRRLGPAGGLGLVAAVAVVIAAGGAGADGRRAVEAAYPVRAPAADDRRQAAGGDERAAQGGDERAVASGDERAVTGGGNKRATAGGAARVVRAYYAALDRGRFRVAWRRLAPEVRVGFGGFVAWRQGYGSTLGHRVERVRVARAGGAVSVRHDLVAVDRTPCGGTTERRFAVAWRLERGRATSLSAVKVAGLDPADSC